MNTQEKINHAQQQDAHSHCDGECEICQMAKPSKIKNSKNYE